mmetsp:Transcript_82311/g.181027  ORF Transcript_82311/g.181027 Transcript_82311/m.181027 type:complete len:1150 (-) Transcript_82311:187-3636(-)
MFSDETAPSVWSVLLDLGNAHAASSAGMYPFILPDGQTNPGVDAPTTPTTPALPEEGVERYASIISVAVFVFISIIIASVMPRLSAPRRGAMRQAGFIALHMADYITNILMMVIVGLSGNTNWLFLLVPVHLAIGIFCMKSALDKTEWRSWSGNSFLNGLFVVVVLGLLQGIQVKLAYDDFKKSMEEARIAEEEALEDPEAIVTAPRTTPSMMPARFHCKAVEGLFESTIFAFVAMRLLLETRLVDRETLKEVVDLEWWGSLILYVSSGLACLSCGLALMEIDYKTSVAIQQELALVGRSPLRKVRHLCFRTSEFMLRILTILLGFALVQVLDASYWWPALAIAIDYVLCVVLIAVFGGRDSSNYYWRSLLALAIPLVVVNVVQFLDAPGLSLRARRISRFLVPLRILEMLGILAACYFLPAALNVTGQDHQVQYWDYLVMHKQWLMFWVSSAVIYFFFLFTYACRLRPGADLHSAVADGDIETLSKLLHTDDLVLDVNRYGPDGRTPLHLAARRGHIECMKLLCKEGADLSLRTANRMKNTALHLAALSKSPGAVQCLCIISNGDGKFINATNSSGDTALHLAAQNQNVEMLQELLQQRSIDVKKKNNRHKTPLDCVGSDKFGFDRNSSENAATEILRRAENGESLAVTSGLSIAGTELAQINKATPSGEGLGTLPEEGSVTRPVDAPETANLEVPDTAMGTEISGVPDRMRQDVPLVQIKPTEEKMFLQKHNNLGKHHTGMQAHTNVASCGLASFVLSAGLGALGFLNLQEEVEQQQQQGGGGEGQPKQVSFDDFEEVRPLGEGAFGKVVLVQLKNTGEQFAMKTMDKAKFKAQKITHKVISEQYILKTTRHPFVVGLHYAFQGSKFWALVMDLCPNGDLMKLLVDFGSPGLPLAEIARYCGEVLLAIEHLHSIRVIFRDLKLDNVVIDTKWRSRVTDFGLAKKLEKESDAKTMCGSYGYAAPEIMTGKGMQYTYAVDLYSFGIMFYMMLSGGTPSSRNPKQRNPPMKHAEFKMKVREAEKNPKLEWSRPESFALELVNQVTSQDPAVRGTAAGARTHRFFTHHLGRAVKDLLADPGPFWPPGGGPEGHKNLVAGTAAAAEITAKTSKGEGGAANVTSMVSGNEVGTTVPQDSNPSTVGTVAAPEES